MSSGQEVDLRFSGEVRTIFRRTVRMTSGPTIATVSRASEDRPTFRRGTLKVSTAP